jgi:transcriptional regulator with XRE-family HTH domain
MNADELKQLQAQAGMTNEDLAEALGVSLSTIVKWRGNQHQIPKPSAIALRALLSARAA